jgi:hypothetical protein
VSERVACDLRPHRNCEEPPAAYFLVTWSGEGDAPIACCPAHAEELQAAMGVSLRPITLEEFLVLDTLWK